MILSLFKETMWRCSTVCVFLCWIARAGDPLAVVPHNVELGLLDGAERCAGLKSHTCSIAPGFSFSFTSAIFLFLFYATLCRTYATPQNPLCRMLLRLNPGLLNSRHLQVSAAVLIMSHLPGYSILRTLSIKTRFKQSLAVIIRQSLKRDSFSINSASAMCFHFEDTNFQKKIEFSSVYSFYVTEFDYRPKLRTQRKTTFLGP